MRYIEIRVSINSRGYLRFRIVLRGFLRKGIELDNILRSLIVFIYTGTILYTSVYVDL
jgi:hypothetical protein